MPEISTRSETFDEFFRIRIHESELLGGLGPEVLSRFNHLRRFKTFRTGEILLSKGQRPNTVFIVLSGTVAFRNRAIHGRSVRPVNATQGEIIGLPEMLTASPFAWKLVAETPCRADLVGLADLEAFLRSERSVRERLIRKFGCWINSAQVLSGVYQIGIVSLV